MFSCENQPWLLRLDKSELGARRGDDCTELFLSRYLAPYVSLPEHVQLPSHFAEQLFQEALSSGRIPEFRKVDWSDKTNNFQVGQIVKDARVWKTNKNESSWSVEIKPKAGYRAISPLIDPQRRIKFQCPRLRDSKYNPWDLFSGDLKRIQHAIRELIKCPRNNFKMWNATWDANDFSSVVPMVSSVLFQEPCLQKVLEMQMLDVIDGDGAILLFEHLVNLCQRQDQVAMDLIDSDWRVDDPALLKGSPIHIENVTPALKSLCKKIQMFAQKLDEAWPSIPSSIDLDKEREEALELLHQLSREDSVFLLQNWLLSLCLCDISIFITFHCVSSDADIQEGSTCTIDRLQDVGVPGLLTVQSLDGNNQINATQFEYRISIIDFDRKPASKLKTRISKEIAFNGLTLNMLEQHSKPKQIRSNILCS